MEFRNIGKADFEKTVWRYMSFAKFISLMVYQALWFSKLRILQDTYEGMIPVKAKQEMHDWLQDYKTCFNTPDLHRQLDAMPARNEKDGRELVVVNCWFLGESESEQMWREYGKSSEAVAIKSTIGRLAKYVLVPSDESLSHIGRVTYIDHSSHEMSAYHANQAHERAFLKDKARFSHEQEIRIATMSVKTTRCVSMEGRPYTAEEVEGKNMNNFENPGLYVGAHLERLITAVVVSPSAQEWFEKMVRRIVELSKLSVPVFRSKVGHT